MEFIELQDILISNKLESVMISKQQIISFKIISQVITFLVQRVAVSIKYSFCLYGLKMAFLALADTFVVVECGWCSLRN